jgi:enoyl-CoA hydratase/carnithine racemase
VKDDAPLLYEVGTDGVALITLNRPESMNSLSPVMLDLWVTALADATRNEKVGAVVITGAGDRAFCAGADLTSGRLGSEEPTDLNAAASRDNLRFTVHRIPRALRLLDKPYIAAINGSAAGAGLDMASMADIRFVSTTAKLTMSYVRMGVVPGDGGAYYLPRILGLQRALHLMLTGEVFTGQEAVEWGYALAAFPSGEVLAQARTYAAALAAGPRVALELIKRLVYRSAGATEDDALSMAAHAMALARTTADATEGPRAFVERRPPRFTGR